MKRPTKIPDVITLRLGEELVTAVDAEGQRIEELQPGLTVTRTDVVRVLLNEALEARAKVRNGERRQRQRQ